MSFLFDAVLLALLALSVFIGYKRGFIKSIMGLGSLIASFFLSYAFSPVLASFIKEKFLLGRVTSTVSETLRSISEKNANGSYNLQKLISDMPEALQELIERYNVDISGFAGAVEESSEKVLHELAVTIADPTVSAISSVAAFILIFVASVMIFTLITWLLDIVFKLPILKTANELLGFALGAVSGVVIVWMLSMLSVELIHALNAVSPALFNDSVIDNSMLLRLCGDPKLLDAVIETVKMKIPH